LVLARRWRVLGLAAALALLLAAAQPWRIAESALQAHVLSTLSDQLGVTIDGARDGAVALLPTPRVLANDLRVRMADGSVELVVPRLRAEVQLLALLAGRVSFDKLILVTPQVTIHEPNGGGLTDPLRLITDVSLSQTRATPGVVIENGAMFVRSGPSIVTAARGVSVEISERSAGDGFEIAGSLLWRGEPVTIAVATDSIARRITPMARLRSAPVNLDFTAARREAGAEPGAALAGTIDVNAPSLSRLGAWIASGSPIVLPLGPTAARGPITFTRRAIEMKSAQITLGADTLEGALDWRRREERWRLSGTLAGRSLDVGRPNSGIEADRLLLVDLASTAPVDVDDLFAHDVDLRLSVQRVRFPGVTLNDVAAQIISTAERLDLSLTNAGLHRGTLKGRATLGRVSDGAGGVDVRVQLNAERVDAGALSAELFDQRRLTGAAFLQHALETRGAAPADLVRNAQGRLSLVVRGGDIAGVNLADVVRRFERQPLSVAREWRGGRTAFEQLSLNGAIGGGAFVLGESQISGAGYQLRLDGAMGLSDSMLRMSGQLQTPNASAVLPFQLSGPLLQPLVSLNLPSILERSGAAQPFLAPRP
jgi:AsmA protein